MDPADWVDDAARNHPHRLFLKTPTGAQCSYESLRDQSGRFASVLTRLGVVAGDRVAVHVDRSTEAVLLYVACLRMGAVFVPINVASTANEVDYFLRDSQPRIAVVRPADRTSVEPLAAGAGIRGVETLGADGAGSLLELVRQSGAEQEPLPGAGANSPAWTRSYSHWSLSQTFDETARPSFGAEHLPGVLHKRCGEQALRRASAAKRAVRG